MKVKQWFSFFVVLCSILLLTACGSNSGSGGDQSAAPAEDDLGSDTETGIQYVGTATCIGCHEDFSWSAEEVSEYLTGKHVNNYAGHYGYEYMVTEGCVDCHDPVGDSPEMMTLLDNPDLVTVGCENCHGAGGEHYGVGPIPVAEPGIDACAKCHDQLPDNHLEHHPEANFIATNFVASRHYTASVRNEAVCSRCHTDLGGRLYKDVTNKAQLEASVLPVESDEPVQCRTCHNPHNAGGLLFEEVEDHGHVVASGEYATCTSCHMSDSVTPDDEEWMYHEDVYYRIIADTHYDDPSTTSVVEGYVINPLNERACRDCHDVHSVEEIRSSSDTDTINDQWSYSGHAGKIGVVKKAVATAYSDMDLNRTLDQTLAIRESGASDDSSNGGFTHYDWDAGDRQSCQKCHTSTGFMNYAADPTTYDAANNDFSHLDGWAQDADTGDVTSSGQNELLYCWGCHSNNSGALRVSGAVTADYTMDGAAVVFPDSGASSICYVCHGGRGNNEVASTSSRFAGHHAPAATTLFSELTNVAYEYPGLDYSKPSYFAHDSLGSAEGTGPCVACHMNGEGANHVFAVANKDDVGAITSIRAENCVSCHDGEHALFVAVTQIGETHDIWNGTELVPTVVTQEHVDEAAEELEHEAEGYQQAGALLTDLLNNQNGLTNYTGAVISQNNALEADRGAFQNAKLPTDEKGGFAHNRYYVKRALFDAIDWAENGQIDGTISDYSAAYPNAISWLGTTRP
nr:multiheme c-type cytochrome [uncultured Desulfuromonas sp.]